MEWIRTAAAKLPVPGGRHPGCGNNITKVRINFSFLNNGILYFAPWLVWLPDLDALGPYTPFPAHFGDMGSDNASLIALQLRGVVSHYEVKVDLCGRAHRADASYVSRDDGALNQDRQRNRINRIGQLERFESKSILWGLM